MIQLARDRTPKAVPADFQGPGKLAVERQLLERRRAGQAPLSSVWKKAKTQLKAESHGKCAYCEGKASHVAHGDVEHYRPKTKYWWLAYSYENYVYACQICNQSHKKAKFPRDGGIDMAEPAVSATSTDAELHALAGSLAPDPLDANAVQQFHADCAAERPGIPDPYVVDPEPLFSWRADDVLKEVELRPRDGSADAQRAFDAAETCLGLNRFELRQWRYTIYDMAAVLAGALKSGQLDAALTKRTEGKLRDMLSDDGEFAGMVRHYVRDVEQLPL